MAASHEDQLGYALDEVEQAKQRMWDAQMNAHMNPADPEAQQWARDAEAAVDDAVAEVDSIHLARQRSA